MKTNKNYPTKKGQAHLHKLHYEVSDVLTIAKRMREYEIDYNLIELTEKLEKLQNDLVHLNAKANV